MLKDNTGMTDVWLQYASVLMKLGRDAEAFRAYQEVVRLKPGEPSGLLGAVSALMALGRLGEAREHAELATKKSPASAHEKLAQIALAQKDYSEAQRQANLAAQADPELPLPVYVRQLDRVSPGPLRGGRPAADTGAECVGQANDSIAGPAVLPG